jgi:hypothetical protein
VGGKNSIDTDVLFDQVENDGNYGRARQSLPVNQPQSRFQPDQPIKSPRPKATMGGDRSPDSKYNAIQIHEMPEYSEVEDSLSAERRLWPVTPDPRGSGQGINYPVNMSKNGSRTPILGGR